MNKRYIESIPRIRDYNFHLSKREGKFFLSLAPVEEGFFLEREIPDLRTLMKETYMENITQSMKEELTVLIIDSELDSGPILLTRYPA